MPWQEQSVNEFDMVGEGVSCAYLAVVRNAEPRMTWELMLQKMVVSEMGRSWVRSLHRTTSQVSGDGGHPFRKD
jgi:hypothetical protein